MPLRNGCKLLPPKVSNGRDKALLLPLITHRATHCLEDVQNCRRSSSQGGWLERTFTRTVLKLYILQTIGKVMQPEAARAVHGWFQGADEKGYYQANSIVSETLLFV